MSLQVPNDLTELLRNPKLLREALETIRALQNLTVRDQDGVRRPIRLSPHNATIDLGPTGAEASSGVDPSAPAGPVAYWPMDESSGDAYDSVGDSDLTNTNVTFGAGLIGNCAIFNGTSAILDRPHAQLSALKFTGSFSFSFWLNLTSLPTGKTYIIMGKFQFTGGNERQYVIAYEDNGGGGYNLFANLSADGLSSTKYNFTVTLATATWLHIVATFDAPTGDVKMYLGGSLLGTVGGVITSLFDGTAPFRMGNTPNNSFWLDGKLDIVAAWDRVITQAEVTALYNGGAGAAPDL
jgi:Concanavalin A-like lectin/glucanases superfamily